MNKDKMKLEEAIEKVDKIRLNFYDKQYKKSYTDDELTYMYDSLSTILQYIKYDSIPKNKIEDRIKAYKKLIDDIRESEHYALEIPLYKHDIQVLQELLEYK